MTALRLVVTGTRHGRSDVWFWLDRWVARFGVPELVIVGDATGVDTQARLWGEARGYPLHIERVEPRTPSPARYHERNQRMVDLARPGDWCVALPDRYSRGTWDCLRRAEHAKLRTRVCDMPLRA